MARLNVMYLCFSSFENRQRVRVKNQQPVPLNGEPCVLQL